MRVPEKNEEIKKKSQNVIFHPYAHKSPTNGLSSNVGRPVKCANWFKGFDSVEGQNLTIPIAY